MVSLFPTLGSFSHLTVQKWEIGKNEMGNGKFHKLHVKPGLDPLSWRSLQKYYISDTIGSVSFAALYLILFGTLLKLFQQDQKANSGG